MLRKKHLIIGGFALAVVILAVAGILLFPYFKSLAVYGSFSGDFSKAGLPVNVKLVLDNKIKSSANVGSAGGDVAVPAQNTKLNIPQGALIANENITAAKIISLQGLPSGWKLVDGYSFEPSGIIFGKPAIFSANSSVVGKEIYAFTIENGQLKRVPYFIKGNQAQVGMSGFSGVAFIQITGHVPYVSNNHSVEDRAVEIIGEGLSIDYYANPIDPKISDSQKARFLKILQIWYSNSVKLHLEDAAKDPAKIKDSGREYNHWLSSAMLLGLDGQLSQQASEGKQLLAQDLKNALEDASKKCTAGGDATQIANMLQWESLAMVLGIENQPGLTQTDLNNYIKSCGKFELDFTSHFSDNQGGQATASGKAELAIADDMTLQGSGTMKEDSMAYPGTSDTDGMIGMPFAFTIPKTPISINAGTSPSASIALRMNMDAIANAQDTLNKSCWWVVNWALAHQSDAIFGTSLTSNIRDWQYVGKNSIFAQKVFNRTVNVPLYPGKIDSITENTIFTLKPASH